MLFALTHARGAARSEEWPQAREDLAAELPNCRTAELPKIPMAAFDQKVQSAWMPLVEVRRRTGAEILARELLESIAGSQQFAPILRQAAAQQLR